MRVNETPFEKSLRRASVLSIRLENEISQTKKLAENGEIKIAYELALKAANTSEKLTLVTRALPAYTGCPTAKEDVELQIADSIPIDIGFTIEGWFSIRIPALLPKKTEGSASYIRSYLYPVMKHFFSYVPPVKYSDCVLIFRHIYNKNRPERQYRDHDNIEVNMVADVVALYVMRDDTPLKCCHYYCSAAGEEERTEVYVVPKKEFPNWLVLEKTFPQKGVFLSDEYQKPP